jgi:hypothetical protein
MILTALSRLLPFSKSPRVRSWYPAFLTVDLHEVDAPAEAVLLVVPNAVDGLYSDAPYMEDHPHTE